MPVLSNPKHERFAQELAKGTTADESATLADIQLAACHDLRRYYVYLLIDPRDGRVFYVGKGTKKRVHAHVREWRTGEVANAPKYERISEIHHAGFKVRTACLVDDLVEADALDTERWLIGIVGIQNLTNLSPGEQSETTRLIANIKDDLKRFRPFCRWKIFILPQFDEVKTGMSHKDQEAVYWDVIGSLTEILAQVEGRAVRKFPDMYQRKAKLPASAV